MKRIALLICAALFAILAVACAPQANDDTASTTTTAATTTTTESVTTTTTVNDGDYDNVMDDIF